MKHTIFPLLFASMFTLSLAPSVARAVPRIGDPESVYDPSKDDPAYPEMKHGPKRA